MSVVADHAHSHTDVATHDSHQPSSVKKYVTIFWILLAVTMIEVAASWLTDVGAPAWLEIAVLIALSVVKGALVVMFYMHLRHDSRWFTFLFSAGIVLAVFGVTVFLVLFSYHRGLVS